MLKKTAFLSSPPNLTGFLHIGHILEFSLQDFVKNFEESFLNKKTICLLGFDHAGLYAEIVASKKRSANNTTLEQIKVNNTIFQNKILQQINIYNFQMNLDILLYTYNEISEVVVRDALLSLDQYIVKKTKIVNYDEALKTVISDLETYKQEEEKTLYYIKYKILNSTSYLTISTSLPQTIESDIFIAVNSKDKRYNHLLNQVCVNPLTGRHLRVIFSDEVIVDFGSGVLKVTPNFSLADEKIYEQLSDSEKNLIDTSFCDVYDLKKGCFNSSSLFYDMKFDEAKLKAIEILQNNNLLIKSEKYVSTVTKSERTNKNIISVSSEQYFVKMKDLVSNSNFDLKNIVLYGCLGMNEINLFTKDMQDWCITRQNNYGHKLYDTHHKLDTWFSSALWPIIFLAFTKLSLENYQITIISGYDIMFYWVYRMFYLSSFILNQPSLYRVIVHGLICDENGNKISKSKGNVVSIDFKDRYESEKFRFYLLTLSVFEKRINLSETKKLNVEKTIVKLNNIINFLTTKMFNFIEIKESVFVSKYIFSFIKYYFVEATEEQRIKNISKIPSLIRNVIGNFFVEEVKYHSDENFDIYMSEILISVILVVKLICCIMPEYGKQKLDLLCNKFNVNIKDLKTKCFKQDVFSAIDYYINIKEYAFIGDIVIYNEERHSKYSKEVYVLKNTDVKVFMKV